LLSSTKSSTSSSPSSSSSSSPSSSSSSSLDDKELTEMFWITPEGLSIEVLAAYSQIAGGSIDKLRRVDDRSGLRQWWENTKQIFNNDNNKKTKLKWSKAPILFIHGSYHAAWCYGEHYLNYFSSLGHNCYAVSLRGTSGTGMPPNDPGEIVRIEKHIYDIQYVLQQIREADDSAPPPIIISHSFGGLITMKLLEIDEVRNNLSGVALLCSVPPSGNGPMTLRFIQSRFWNSIKIVYGFVLKAATTNVDLCTELFFDNTFNKTDVQRYMRNFRSDSRVGLDLQALASVLPSVNSINGRAPWLSNNNNNNIETTKKNENKRNIVDNNSTDSNNTLITPPKVFNELILNTVLSQYENNSSNVTKQSEANNNVKRDKVKKIPTTTTTTTTMKVVKNIKKQETLAKLVIGAEKDYIVDEDGINETAYYLGVEPVIIKDLYHDVMLGPKWKLSAYEIEKWLTSIQ
jgi:pimeloyl-ACP methyl ester carboxylesterase